jgi:predicted nucleotidyltransferase
VLLVGSYSRNAARADSDVDLVILANEPARYLDSISFAVNFGRITKWQKEDWGKVTSMRVWYEEGLEVEYGFALPSWAAEPLDEGTKRVLDNGALVIFERAVEQTNRQAKNKGE